MSNEALLSLYRSSQDKEVLAWVVFELDKRLNKMQGHAVARIKAIEKRQGEEVTEIIELEAA